MGFYTYSVTSTVGTALFNDFVAWLNSNGVSCTSGSGGVVNITDFNGMSGKFTFSTLAYTGSAPTSVFKFVLVTDVGKELIAIQGVNTSKAGTDVSHFEVFGLIFNRNGTLYYPPSCDGYSIQQTQQTGSGFATINRSVSKDATADNYLIPFIFCPNNESYKLLVFDNYYLSYNLVEVPPGVIISDGTKQFISCGLFLFVEYNPATMSA